MKYLIKKKQLKRRAHYWTGNDTACRMASTGGLNLSQYTVSDTCGGRKICELCQRSDQARRGPEKVANPGSEEAVKMGCTCPVIDNHHGQGIPVSGKNGEVQFVFWSNADCPLHGFVL